MLETLPPLPSCAFCQYTDSASLIIHSSHLIYIIIFHYVFVRDWTVPRFMFFPVISNSCFIMIGSLWGTEGFIVPKAVWLRVLQSNVGQTGIYWRAGALHPVEFSWKPLDGNLRSWQTVLFFLSLSLPLSVSVLTDENALSKHALSFQPVAAWNVSLLILSRRGFSSRQCIVHLV